MYTSNESKKQFSPQVNNSTEEYYKKLFDNGQGIAALESIIKDELDKQRHCNVKLVCYLIDTYRYQIDENGKPLPSININIQGNKTGWNLAHVAVAATAYDCAPQNHPFIRKKYISLEMLSCYNNDGFPPPFYIENDQHFQNLISVLERLEIADLVDIVGIVIKDKKNQNFIKTQQDKETSRAFFVELTKLTYLHKHYLYEGNEKENKKIRKKYDLIKEFISLDLIQDDLSYYPLGHWAMQQRDYRFISMLKDAQWDFTKNLYPSGASGSLSQHDGLILWAKDIPTLSLLLECDVRYDKILNNSYGSLGENAQEYEKVIAQLVTLNDKQQAKQLFLSYEIRKPWQFINCKLLRDCTASIQIYIQLYFLNALRDTIKSNERNILIQCESMLAQQQYVTAMMGISNNIQKLCGGLVIPEQDLKSQVNKCAELFYLNSKKTTYLFTNAFKAINKNSQGQIALPTIYKKFTEDYKKTKERVIKWTSNSDHQQYFDHTYKLLS